MGAISGLGIGADAYRAAIDGQAARSAIARDPALSAAGLARPFAARAPSAIEASRGGDRATDLLLAALKPAVAGLDATRPHWRNERVGVAIGTSSGGMITATRFFAARARGEATADLARGATYFAPLDDALAAVGLAGARRTQVLAACAASAIAIGIALRWLERGACDVVLAGGYDGVSEFVAAGFEALRATTASSPRPFRVGRDGMSLGEGAAVLGLVRGDDTRGAQVIARIAGFGGSNDAVHITAPDRTGSGLARAGCAALVDAGMAAAQIDLVSAHATATPFNDAMESRALATILGDAQAAIVHPFKAQIGHTLGAAGVLEALAAADALSTGVAPAAAGGSDGAPLDPDAPTLLLDRSARRPLRGALKLAAAFGGTNGALVLAPPDAPSARPSRPIREVFVRAFAHTDNADLGDLSAATGVARDRLARLDSLCRLGLAAVASLAAAVGRDAIAGAGIVAGQALATLDTNDGFDARRRARGATSVEPRVFPATSPNAIVGECAIVFKLTGPSFAVGAGLDGAMEALSAAAELVAAGDADRVIVVAADDAGPVAHDLLHLAGWDARPLVRGAVALLLTSDGEGSLRTVDLDAPVAHEGDGPIGHSSLMRWLGR
ncbi:3-oxoacyl-[acyl-carrier-protein] synthase, KASII [Minicystis rosea]|nr:3-oxoacyl-[acyl-carrier-protein] synthase, KASII [Minicystis rosea]